MGGSLVGVQLGLLGEGGCTEWRREVQPTSSPNPDDYYFVFFLLHHFLMVVSSIFVRCDLTSSKSSSGYPS
jgi:hypothetical protein